MSETVTIAEVQGLLDVVRQLRDPARGCPWDRAQTLASLAPYTLEEAYEVVDAIDRRDWSELRAELGDLLFQIVLQSQLADEAGYFNFEDVCRAIKDKMIHRHPHVFDPDYRGAELPDWDALKASEPGRAAVDAGVLAGVAAGMPAWLRAQKLQQKAARVGFDWNQPLQALAKLEEEVAEVRAELEGGGTPQRLEDELGDVLFAVISLARHAHIDVSRAMRGANRKFEARFRQMEAQAQGRDLATLPREAWQALWQQAKQAVPGVPEAASAPGGPETTKTERR